MINRIEFIRIIRRTNNELFNEYLFNCHPYLRGGLDDLRIDSRMCYTLVQAMTARLIGGSTSVEFGRPSYDCRMFTSLDGLEHGRVLQTNLCGVIGVTERHRYTDT